MKRENLVFGGLAILAVILVVMMNVITARYNDGMEGNEVFSYISATSMGGFKESSLFGDVISMYKNFDGQLFKGGLLFIISIFAILTILLLVRHKIKWQTIGKSCFLILLSLIYFYGVSKASPSILCRCL